MTKSRWTCALTVITPVSLVAFALSVALTGTAARAAGIDVTQLPKTFDAPNLKTGGAENMLSILTSCFNVTSPLELFGQIAKGSQNPQFVNIDTKCETPPLYDAPECKDLPKTQKDLDNQIKELLAKDDLAMSGLSCQKAKFGAIEGELGCINGKSSQLQSQISTLQAEYDKNISKYKGDVDQLKSIQGDREAQNNFVMNRIGGNKQTGARGIGELSNLVAGMYDQMAVEVPNYIQSLAHLTADKARLEQQIKFKIAGNAAECFKNQPLLGTNDRCYDRGPDGKPATQASIMQNILCKYKQALTQNGNSNLEGYNSIVDGATSQKAAGLEAVLNQILADSPNMQDIIFDVPTPGSPPDKATLQGNINTVSNQKFGVLTPDDLIARYGNRLSQFTGVPFDVRGYIIAGYKSCYNTAVTRVNAERTSPDSKIYLAQQGLQDQTSQLNAALDKSLNGYARLYDEGIKALTGVNNPINISACFLKQRDQIMSNCLKNMQAKMNDLLRGSVNYTTKILVQGTLPQNNFYVVCRGLNGCLADLQRKGEQLTTEVTKIKAFKDSYISKANAQVEAFTSKMVTGMRNTAKELDSTLQRINNALIGLGVGRGLKVEHYTSKDGDPQPDKDGLLQPPTSIIDYIGSRIGLVKLGGDNTDSMQGIADGKRDLDKKIADASQAEQKIKSLKTKCPGDRADSQLAAAEASASQLVGKCASSQWCTTGDNLSTLTEAINDLGGKLQDSDAINNLSTSISGACAGRRTDNEGIKRQLATANAQVNTLLQDPSADQNRISTLQNQVSILQSQLGQDNGDNCGAIFEGIRAKVARASSALGKLGADSAK